MEHQRSQTTDILPVLRTKAQARRLYDRISGVYGWLFGAFENKYAEIGLMILAVEAGEAVLEVGFGAGHCLERIAWSVGNTGKAHGADISSGMVNATMKRLRKAGLEDRSALLCADGASLPYRDSVFDAAFMSFTLELFDTPDIPRVLSETMRVLKPGGRLGVVSMSRENGESIPLKLYEWAHGRWPAYLDCRPIHVERAMLDADFVTGTKKKVSLFRLPAEIVVGVKPD
ncbi:MAG: methyltransferase domain-containing protein [Dehalococcoidia bacterium]|jgi:demethylmenaquinone methyltransferase/2-methoxy-6-polyprenyl-1,4-benzoquinol methylase|nr:methyltransferase domain-containing protein [Dehalococcoidia bacterium]